MLGKYKSKIAVVSIIAICLCITGAAKLNDTGETNSADYLYLSSDSKLTSNDLFHRTINEPYVTLERGQEIAISVMNGEAYEDVYISFIGMDITQKIGLLNEDISYTYCAPASGKYMICTGNHDTNITDDIVIEYVNNITDNLYLLN